MHLRDQQSVGVLGFILLIQAVDELGRVHNYGRRLLGSFVHPGLVFVANLFKDGRVLGEH